MPYGYKEGNKLGGILVPTNIIAQLAVMEVLKFDNKVFLTNSKGKRPTFVSRTIGNTEINNVEVTVEDNLIDVKLYVMIKFGISISKTVNDLIENIKKRIELTVGVLPKSVSVVVTGTMSKNVAKRNIEVKRKYDINNG